MSHELSAERLVERLEEENRRLRAALGPVAAAVRRNRAMSANWATGALTTVGLTKEEAEALTTVGLTKEDAEAVLACCPPPLPTTVAPAVPAVAYLAQALGAEPVAPGYRTPREAAQAGLAQQAGPAPGAALPLAVARRTLRCRICGEIIKVDLTSVPVGWQDNASTLLHPDKVTLNFGAEFAHTACLPPSCQYCDRPATRTLVWLKDKQQRPARIQVPWCGCDLQEALKRFWRSPYTVREGVDYAVEDLVGDHGAGVGDDDHVQS